MGRNVKIVETAQYRPGGDLITGDPEGPFLDLGLTLGAGKARRGDRIYLALKHLTPVLREAGWHSPEDVEEMVDRLGELEAREVERTEAQEKLDSILDAVSGFFEPEVKEVEVVRTVPREPTDEEVRAYVRKHRTDLLRTSDKASDEAYRRIYGGLGYIGGQQPAAVPSPGQASDPTVDPRQPRENVNLGDGDNTPSDPQVSHFELQGQVVNLDEVLAGSVKEVVAFAEGHPDEFKEALVEREYAADKPRKGVIEGLGYAWEPAEDETPADDESEGEEE